MSLLDTPLKASLVCYIDEDVELVMENYVHLFNNNGVSPKTQAQQIVIALIKDLVFSRANYLKKFDVTDELSKYLNPSLNKDAINQFFNNVILDIVSTRSLITQFLGNDRWIMHHVFTKGTAIMIEKSIDYRIYQWSVEHKVPL